MDTLRLDTAHHVPITIEVAGLAERILAALIDVVVMAIYIFIAVFVLAAASAPSWLFGLLLGLPVLLYHPLCEIVLEGRTVGKDIMRVRVARLDGSPPGAGAAMARWLIGLVEITMTSGLVAMGAILFGRTGQRLGDRVAGTAVVRNRPEAARPDAARRRLDESLVVFPEAAYLAPADAAVVRDVVAQLHAMGRTGRAERLAQRTKAVVEQKLGIAPVEMAAAAFLRQVLADYHRDPDEALAPPEVTLTPPAEADRP